MISTKKQFALALHSVVPDGVNVETLFYSIGVLQDKVDLLTDPKNLRDVDVWLRNAKITNHPVQAVQLVTFDRDQYGYDDPKTIYALTGNIFLDAILMDKSDSFKDKPVLETHELTHSRVNDRDEKSCLVATSDGYYFKHNSTDIVVSHTGPSTYRQDYPKSPALFERMPEMLYIRWARDQQYPFQ